MGIPHQKYLLPTFIYTRRFFPPKIAFELPCYALNRRIIPYYRSTEV